MPCLTILFFHLRVFPKHRIPAISLDLEMLRNDHRHSCFRNSYRNLRHEVDREVAEVNVVKKLNWIEPRGSTLFFLPLAGKCQLNP